MTTKVVSIVVSGDNDTAVTNTARRVVNTMNNVADWSSTNYPGGVSSIKATTKDVTVVSTDANFVKNASGILVPA